MDNNINKKEGILLSVLMPCLNEEKAIGSCIRKALNAIEKLNELEKNN